ncbi:hypothetical protein [uncultured Methanospirillum sp.]|uniref:hypothetical protein n=1 Tax=uncultured Methanospirillum sp. TaxID=262503 RepID=UPI0029C984AD|nr:hypothetical protein [uncultured Methanospirillum sp.]
MKPFVRTKVIKGKEYLYEVTPYYDPETGKWRQKTKYLGKNIDGEPVKKERGGKSGQIYDFGEYLPAYWAVKEYKILESLLSICSPDEASSVVLLAINRLYYPSPPANLNTWLESTYLSKLIPEADFDEENLMLLLQKISDRPVAELFSQMFSSVNDLSDQRVLFTLRLHDIPELMREKGSGLYCEEMLERELGVRIQYDPIKKTLAGFEAFQVQRAVIEDSIDRVCYGNIPGGVIVPHWDYLSPSLMMRLIHASCQFITRTDASYGPVASHVLTWGEQMDHPANIRYYHGEACYIRPFSVKFGKISVPGYILHDIKKEQADRLAFHKNLQGVRDLIQETRDYPGTIQELVNEASGPFRRFFVIVENNGSYQIRIDQDEMNLALKKLGRSCVLYQGNFTWEDCFTLVDLRGEFEKEMSQFISELERDFKGYRLERIRKGVFFICFLAMLIKYLILNRIQKIQTPEISTFESLITELRPIHIVKSYQPSVSPARLSRRQKSIVSFLGGIPPMKGD